MHKHFHFPHYFSSIPAFSLQENSPLKTKLFLSFGVRTWGSKKQRIYMQQRKYDLALERKCKQLSKAIVYKE
jgi:hypothetical protein